MGSVYLFDVASRQAQWLSVRQATISGNIANANTPGFKALEVESFADALDKTQLKMVATESGHIGYDTAQVRSAKIKKADSWDILHSGNSVSLEQEMAKADEVNRAHSLNTGIVKAFHRMVLSAAKGGQ
ncbi:flagellar basal body rod protein FlgB [Microvirga sp. 2MCAF38]|uniref:flagellar basal body rod protein FlgB n=1 Tax=Microvirga sp. 2MCAF38 TaxID=3232989 RepID=UPI003F953A94